MLSREPHPICSSSMRAESGIGQFPRLRFPKAVEDFTVLVMSSNR